MFAAGDELELAELLARAEPRQLDHLGLALSDRPIQQAQRSVLGLARAARLGLGGETIEVAPGVGGDGDEAAEAGRRRGQAARCRRA
ncbi:MAG: hypothetical protein HC927_05620 [Deltaproteobacteria bacterium]|nr:hypothetical protein [Deltaproteobacteria bacterium]